MKSLGIIAEYNPFHQGHKYLIEKAMKKTKADVCISVMSGNFVQRGTPAIANKWTRAQIAVKNGVNLVVELPTVYACNSAEYFSKGGIQILEGFGSIDYIAFGSEIGDIDKLKKISDFILDNNEILHQRIAQLMKIGKSYPNAREIAILELDSTIDGNIIKEPNNILGIEYLKQIRTMEPYTVKRRGYGYHESATMIRDEMFQNEPEKYNNISQRYFDLVASKILQTDSEKLEKIFSAGDGLGNKLKNEIRYVSSSSQLIDRIKSKAYTHSRISRLLTQVLLDIDYNSVYNAENYIRVLAFDEIGAKFLKKVKKEECCSMPIITNINKEIQDYPQIKNTLSKDILASDMFNIINKLDLYDYSDFIIKPYIHL